MASPQVENGYIRIANELWEALSRVEMSGAEFRVVLAILRQTYGRQGKEAIITHQELMKATGIADSGYLSRMTSALAARRIIIKWSSWGKPSNYGPQKDYDEWQGGQSVTNGQTVSTGQTVTTGQTVSTDGASHLTERQPPHLIRSEKHPPLPPPPSVEGVRKGSKPESKVESGKSKVESGKSKVETPNGCSWCRTTRADDTTVVQDLMRLYHDRFKGTLGRCPVAFEARAGKVLATLLKRVDGREIGIAISHLFRSTDVWIVEHAYPVTKLLTDFDVLRERPLGATPNARRTGIRI